MTLAPYFDHESRRERLRSLLGEQGLEWLVVSRPVHVGYLTGFTGDSTVFIMGLRRDLLVSDGRYTEQLARECPGLETHIRTPSQKLVDIVPQVLGQLGASAVGVEAAGITLAEMERWRELQPGLAWKSTQGLVEGLRRVKDAGELAELRLAVRQAQAGYLAWTHGKSASQFPRQTEKQAANSLEWALREAGAEESAFPLIVAGNDGAALPHYHPGDIPMPESGVLLVDWGARTARGYRSDLTRTVRVGSGPLSGEPGLEVAHEAVCRAQQAALPWLRPGVQAGQVDLAIRSELAKAGLDSYFVHGSGHGIGLEIHESPWFRANNTELLEAGMVVTIEPGVYFPGRWGIRVEDDFLVTPDGGVCLSDLPRGLEPQAGS